MQIEIMELGPNDAGVLSRAAPDVFDDDVDDRATSLFLTDPTHHIVVARDDGVVVGFVSAVHYHHPDKPSPELWINEVGVAPSHHRLGLGKAILARMLDVARSVGCSQAWVLTDRTNVAAMGLYASAGGVVAPGDTVMVEFTVGEPESGSTRERQPSAQRADA